MKAIFKSTEGEYLEAVLEIGGVDLRVMDGFGGELYKSGDEIDVELMNGLQDEDEDQNSMLDSNLDGKKTLIHLNGWAYRAYGVVTNIDDETIVDIGICELTVGFDTTILGEGIAFTLKRLDATII